MQIRTRKLLSVLLTLLIMAGVIAAAPVTASAAGPLAPNGSAVWDFTAVDADGSGTGWAWVQSTKTLTLTNFTHSTSAATALELPSGSAIVLNGTNTITSTYSAGSGNAYGIECGGALTITGSGSLDVKSGGAGTSYGIDAVDSITFSGAVTVKATTGTASAPYGLRSDGGITINDTAAVTAEHGPAGGTGRAISASSGVTINGGSLTALATQNVHYLFDPAYTVPSGFVYWTNSLKTASGASGPFTSTGATSFNKADASTQYVRIELPPVLSAGSVSRTSDTAATVGFTTDKAGTAYYISQAGGAAAPTNTAVKGGTSLGAVTAGANTGKAVTLVAGARDIYVVVDAGGVLSAPLKIAAAAYSSGGGTNAKGIFGTNARYTQWWCYILFFLCFGFIWMWF